MLTRRQLLVSAAVLGTPTALALPVSGERHHRHRMVGLLQNQRPFVDEHDIVGSKARAYIAFRVLLERSLKDNPEIDWVLGSAFPLTGPGPFPKGMLGQLALFDGAEEIRWLKSLAHDHAVSLSFGAWWRTADGRVTQQLLSFAPDGHFQAHRPGHPPVQFIAAPESIRVPEPHRRQTFAKFAAECGHRCEYGAWVEDLRYPTTLPDVPRGQGPVSALIGPDGQPIVVTESTRESCLVASLA